MVYSFWQNKKILLTGASGFIGSHFFRVLSSAGANVIGLSLGGPVVIDLLDKEKLFSLCCLEKPEFIIHCAALDGNAEFKKLNSKRILAENVLMAENVLAAVKNFGIKRLIFMSSVEVDSAISSGNLFPISDYIQAKILAEKMFLEQAAASDLQVMILRSANVYGSGDKRAEDFSRVIPAMIKRAEVGEPIEIWGDGKQRRNFIHVSDLVDVALRLAESGHFSSFDISGPEWIAIKDLAALIVCLTGSTSEIIFRTDKTSGLSAREVDLSPLKRLIGFSPRSLESGLKDLIKSYAENKKRFIS
jgi:dTDP-4-dehydro-6-deoxy-alpha-D-gulose 4-ketoreductase